MTVVNVTVDAKSVNAMLKASDKAVTQLPQQAWREVQKYTSTVADLMFKQNATGGTFRGVTWEDFESPAARGQGALRRAELGLGSAAPSASPAGRKGRNRLIVRGKRKGKRYWRIPGNLTMSASDNLNQARGGLRRATGATFQLLGSGSGMTMATNYKKGSFDIARLMFLVHDRPALFFTQADEGPIANIAAKWHQIQVKKAPGVA